MTSDRELIRDCLAGNGQAWEELVGRYRKLVYSIPLKYGLDRDDAMEVFQSVWLDCFQELHTLRDLDRLQAWLVRIAVRKCYRLREKAHNTPAGVPLKEDHSFENPTEELIRRVDQEQLIRLAIEKSSPRCKQVIEALFFEEPFPTYATIAARLGLSSNSIGFTRDRCLERLGKLLEELGYEY